MQQVKHGALLMLAQFHNIGHAIRGTHEPDLRQYTQVGDGASKTDGRIYDPKLGPNETKGDYSGKPDDRWIFTTNNSYFQWNAIATLAAAADTLKGWDDALAKDCLEAAIKAWKDTSANPTLYPTSGGPDRETPANGVLAASQGVVSGEQGTGKPIAGVHRREHDPVLMSRHERKGLAAVRNRTSTHWGKNRILRVLLGRCGTPMNVIGPIFSLVGSDHTLEVAGIRLLGFNEANGRKLVLTLVFFLILYLLSKALRFLANQVGGKRQRVAFWTRQAISLITFVLGVTGFISVWFDNPARLATGAGLVAAGLAFALQKVITSFAGYFVILRGKTFNVGDRISMGNVRGDVIALNFIQTVIMEMGEPPAVQSEDPGMWVRSRQYSGRIVTISNARIFEEPVYNYSRDFPYIWEEMQLPISFKDDRNRAEQIILEVVQRNTEDIANLAQPELDRMRRSFFIEAPDIRPRVYLRITDNWVELSVRFLCRNHDIRGLKDRISREILSGLEDAKIGIASSTYDVVGFPPIRLETSERTGPADIASDVRLSAKKTS